MAATAKAGFQPVSYILIHFEIIKLDTPTLFFGAHKLQMVKFIKKIKIKLIPGQRCSYNIRRSAKN